MEKVSTFANTGISPPQLQWCDDEASSVLRLRATPHVCVYWDKEMKQWFVSQTEAVMDRGGLQTCTAALNFGRHHL
ncbi:unnamed protein product [Pleuronectes platessa]|uniref:Uncharacterized protein n=1 Tax=Pleuronectes platessa TaxID=8262 RepID=A0A9N7TRP5_PLEPL|nr:unnamed protein product [Pleuronectes platessa]